MAAPKKFGAFAGVFTPSILTILGVIMYMRFGWVVGNAGLWGTLIVVFIAHIISFTTGLSISSIATDKKIGAGGVYYVLSRSLGLPIGGAIGLTLFVGTAFSIALYLIGFSESFNSFLGFDTTLNGYRITAGIALLILTIIAFISTSIALKTQFFILVAIFLSLISIFFGHSDFVPETVSSFGGTDSVPMETVFAIFFPAVTGFTAGIAMSGDLKNPKKSIPFGTMAAIFVGLFVYVGLAIFIAFMIDPEVLKKDNNILLKIAWISPFVVAGIWGATLSSAIGGVLGGPRILQAMSLDKITPMIFGKGQGKNNEPRWALILTVIIAFAGILIGELNLIARLVSMFYLAAYGFINLSFFLESWASSDFKPSFKVNKWIGFVGFVTTFIIMFKLDMLAMFLSFVVIGGVYLWLSKKQISLGEGDIWQSVWTNIVKKGLWSLDEKEDHKRNWKPNILLFSGKQKSRVHLLEFSQFLASKMGIVTNFDLIENKKSGELFSKHNQSYNDDVLKKFGVFGRQLEVNNIYDGIGTIASVFGFSGIEPNTILMGWARNSKDPTRFSKMTNKLIGLDYNVLYLDYDKEMGFGKYETIDLWWRGISSNAELSLMIVKLLAATSEWGMAKIRIILVNNTGNDHQIIKKKIENLIESFRVKAEVFIINNFTDNKSIFNLMKIHSGTSDLIILGVPDIIKNQEDKFVDQVNDLVDVLGTTLLVKASSKFEVADLGVSKTIELEKENTDDFGFIPKLMDSEYANISMQLKNLDNDLIFDAVELNNSVFITISNRIKTLVEKYENILLEALELKDFSSKFELQDRLVDAYQSIVKNTESFSLNDLVPMKEIIDSGINSYLEKREKLFNNQKSTLRLLPNESILSKAEQDSQKIGKIKKELYTKKSNDQDYSLEVKWKELVKVQNEIIFSKEFNNILSLFLNKQSELLAEIPEKLHTKIIKFVHLVEAGNEDNNDLVIQLKRELKDLFTGFDLLISDIYKKPSKQLRFVNRNTVNKISGNFVDLESITSSKTKLNREERKENRKYKNKNDDFGEFWLEVQKPIFTKEVNDFNQTSLYISIIQASDKVRESFKDEVFTNFGEVLNKLGLFLKKIELIDFGKDGFIINNKDFAVDGINIDSDKALSLLHVDINDIINKFPEEILVLTQNSFDELIQNKLEDIETIDLPMSKIVNHIFSSELLSPLEKQFDNLRINIEELKTKVNNIVSLLNYTSNYIDNDKVAELKSLIKEINTEYSLTKNKFDYTVVAFDEHFMQTVNQLELKLNTNHILNNISELNLHIKKNKRDKGLKLLINKWNSRIKSESRKAVDYISKKNEDVKRLEYENKLNVFIPEHLVVKEVVSKIKAERDVLNELPFYYQQIFTGKHFSIHKKALNRSRELKKADQAIKEIHEGIKAGVLVTGSSGMGKSFFVDNFTGNYLKGQVIKVKIEDLSVKKPFEKALKAIVRKNGNLDFLFNSFAKDTIFVFEDIESYIGVNEKDKPLLDVLAEIIDKYGGQYMFLLTANSYSLQTINSISKIMGSIVSTIALLPLSNSEIYTLIKERHFAGNVVLIDDEGEEMSEKQTDKVLQNVIDLSKGNPGMAMQLWLSSMKLSESGIGIDPDIEILNIESNNSIWLSLLSRMIVFGHLLKSKIVEVYGKEMEGEIEKNINLLEKAGLIDCINKSDYQISNNIKPFVEVWLKDKELI